MMMHKRSTNMENLTFGARVIRLEQRLKEIDDIEKEKELKNI